MLYRIETGGNYSAIYVPLYPSIPCPCPVFQALKYPKGQKQLLKLNPQPNPRPLGRTTLLPRQLLMPPAKLPLLRPAAILWQLRPRLRLRHGRRWHGAGVTRARGAMHLEALPRMAAQHLRSRLARLAIIQRLAPVFFSAVL